MMLRSTLERFFSATAWRGKPASRHRGPKLARRLRHEWLEDRRLLAVINIAGDGDFVVQMDPMNTNVQVFDDGVLVANQALAGVTAINITGGAGKDSLTVDYINGNPIPVDGIAFNGQAGFDTLAIRNNINTTVVYNYTSVSSGNINLDGSVISFTNLEPIVNSGDAVTAIFNLPNTADTATLTQLNGNMLLSGSTFEDTTFTTPTSALVINGGGGQDTLRTGGPLTLSDVALTIDAENVMLQFPTTVRALTTTGNRFTAMGDIQTTDGAINITAAAGYIYVNGCLNSFTGIQLSARTYVSVNGNIMSGCDLVSAGTDFWVSGQIMTSSVNLDGHTGAVTIYGNVGNGPFSAINVARFTLFGDLCAESIDISTGGCGYIYVAGNINSLGDVNLAGTKYVSIGGTVEVCMGNFISSGCDLYIKGPLIVCGGGINLDGHVGAVTVHGPVMSQSFSAEDVARLNIVGSLTVFGDIDISTTCGPIIIGDPIVADGNVTLDSATYVSLGGIQTCVGDFTSSGCDFYVCGPVFVCGDINLDGHAGNVSIEGPVVVNSLSALNVRRFALYGDLFAPDGVNISTACDYIYIAGVIDTVGAAVVLDSRREVILGGDVMTFGGDFTASGTTFTARGIDVGPNGTITLDFLGVMNISGTLDAGDYVVASPGDLRLLDGARIVFYVDTTAPGPSPQLVMNGGGNLEFLAGSTVQIIATGDQTASGTFTLADIQDGGVVIDGGFNLVVGGPAAADVDQVYAIDDLFIDLF